jgi:predicted GNAT family acetyltransferase
VRTAEQIEIAGIQVLPDYQGRGIGTAVITALTQEGAVKGLPTMLEVEKDNPDAKRLYLRLGFEQQGETHDTFRMTVYPPLRQNHESEASATDRDVGKRQVHRDQQAG